MSETKHAACDHDFARIVIADDGFAFECIRCGETERPRATRHVDELGAAFEGSRSPEYVRLLWDVQQDELRTWLRQATEAAEGATRALSAPDGFVGNMGGIDKIEPAMTAEEWAKLSAFRMPNVLHVRDGEWVNNGHGWIDVAEMADEPGDRGCSAMVSPEARHALAALALHDQSFGFTWADVDAIHDVFAATAGAGFDQSQLVSLADRIAALLPPRAE